MVDDIASERAWRALADNPNAQLVDVRTDAEWMYVGLPDLAEIDKQTLLIAWQNASGAPNQHFVRQLDAAGLTDAHEIYFICRSGARSLAAAEAARMAGYAHVYNVADGFEGPHDANGHRGGVAGWKASGLPWRQR